MRIENGGLRIKDGAGLQSATGSATEIIGALDHAAQHRTDVLPNIV